MLENRPTVSVVVMTFNEEATVAAVVREIQDVLRGLERPYEILAVNDGSSDGTAAQLAALARELPNVRVITHEVNQGLGGVYRTGFGQACGRYVTFFPADGQFPATIIRQFLPLMDRQDMVLGYLPKRDGPWLSKILSYVERVLYHVLFGSMPRFQGILMFRRSLLAELPALRSSGRGWAVLMELILRTSRAGCRVVSVPTGIRPRTSGMSKVNNWRTILSNLRQLKTLHGMLAEEKREGNEAIRRAA
jgi:glycosyltransferase involved in cell wall biosynthesis